MKKIILLTAFFILQMANAFASVEKHVDNGTNYEMSYPIVYTKDKAAQDRINQDIYHYIATFRDDFQKGKFSGQYYSGKFSYDVKFEDNDYISLVIMDYRTSKGSAHGGAKKFGLVYDKKTGRKLPRSHFLKMTLQDLLDFYTSHTYSGYEEKLINVMGYSKPERVSDDYYLLGNGGIALIYREYEITAYVYGSPTIRFSKEEVDYFNRKNRNL